MIDSKYDGCGDADVRHEGVRAPVKADVDAPPVFELAEHDLDYVALAIEHDIVRRMDSAERTLKQWELK